MNIQKIIATLIIIFSFASCDLRKARLKDFDKDYWIQIALGTPLSLDISELQGIGDTWQGFGCYFRFKMKPENLQNYLIANGYEEKNVADYKQNFAIGSLFEEYFSPKWNPNLGESSKVFVRHPSDYQTTILVSPGSDWVHVFTSGSHNVESFPKNHITPLTAPGETNKPAK